MFAKLAMKTVAAVRRTYPPLPVSIASLLQALHPGKLSLERPFLYKLVYRDIHQLSIAFVGCLAKSLSLDRMIKGSSAIDYAHTSCPARSVVKSWDILGYCLAAERKQRIK